MIIILTPLGYLLCVVAGWFFFFFAPTTFKSLESTFPLIYSTCRHHWCYFYGSSHKLLFRIANHFSWLNFHHSFYLNNSLKTNQVLSFVLNSDAPELINTRHINYQTMMPGYLIHIAYKHPVCESLSLLLKRINRTLAFQKVMKCWSL